VGPDVHISNSLQTRSGADLGGTPTPLATLGSLNYSPPFQKRTEAKYLTLVLYQQKGFCVGRPSREHPPQKNYILQNRKQSCNTLLRVWPGLTGYHQKK